MFLWVARTKINRAMEPCNRNSLGTKTAPEIEAAIAGAAELRQEISVRIYLRSMHSPNDSVGVKCKAELICKSIHVRIMKVQRKKSSRPATRKPMKPRKHTAGIGLTVDAH